MKKMYAVMLKEDYRVEEVELNEIIYFSFEWFGENKENYTFSKYTENVNSSILLLAEVIKFYENTTQSELYLTKLFAVEKSLQLKSKEISKDQS